MVEPQIERRGVGDRRVLQAMREVAREAFVDAEMEEFAFDAWRLGSFAQS